MCPRLEPNTKRDRLAIIFATEVLEPDLAVVFLEDYLHNLNRDGWPEWTDYLARHEVEAAA